MSLLGILKLKKDTGAIVHQPESILCTDVTFFESVPYFSPQGPFTISESISLSPYIPLPVLAVVHDVSSTMLLKDTTSSLAPKPPRKKDFSYVYTHRQKVPAFESVPTASFPVEGLPPQPSVFSSDFDVPIAIRKGKWSCIDHPISHFV